MADVTTSYPIAPLRHGRHKNWAARRVTAQRHRHAMAVVSFLVVLILPLPAGLMISALPSRSPSPYSS
jgi:hypothetical protein